MRRCAFSPHTYVRVHLHTAHPPAPLGVTPGACTTSGTQDMVAFLTSIPLHPGVRQRTCALWLVPVPFVLKHIITQGCCSICTIHPKWQAAIGPRQEAQLRVESAIQCIDLKVCSAIRKSCGIKGEAFCTFTQPLTIVCQLMPQHCCAHIGQNTCVLGCGNPFGATCVDCSHCWGMVTQPQNVYVDRLAKFLHCRHRYQRTPRGERGNI